MAHAAHMSYESRRVSKMHRLLAQHDDQAFARRVWSLPSDLFRLIAFHVDLRVRWAHRSMPAGAGNPAIPPRSGASPFLALPLELRRKILLEFLPAKETVIEPTAMGNPESTTCNLLVLNKQLCHEISTILYEERTFGVHVYEGVYSGGIAFLNSGLQRLQHKDNFQDVHFKRFGDDDEYGFSRVKRLVLTVHPCYGRRTLAGRHDPIYTHLMMHELVRLLEVRIPKREITYCKIKLLEPEYGYYYYPDPAGYSFIPIGPEDYWWNPLTQAARESSVYGISNIELILRPFYHLYRVHNVEIELPRSLNQDLAMQRFKAHLSGAMTSKGSYAEWDDDLDHKIEVARDSLDDWLFTVKYGKAHGVNHMDVWLTDGEWDGEFEYGDDDFPVLTRCGSTEAEDGSETTGFDDEESGHEPGDGYELAHAPTSNRPDRFWGAADGASTPSDHGYTSTSSPCSDIVFFSGDGSEDSTSPADSPTEQNFTYAG